MKTVNEMNEKEVRSYAKKLGRTLEMKEQTMKDYENFIDAMVTALDEIRNKYPYLPEASHIAELLDGED